MKPPKSIDSTKLGLYLKELRKNEGLTLMKVETETGIDSGTLSKTERGMPMSEINLKKLFKFYKKDYHNEIESFYRKDILPEKGLCIGIDSSCSESIKVIINPIKKGLNSFTFYNLEQIELISSLQKNTIQLVLIPFNTIKNRIELIPIASVTKDICFATLRSISKDVKESDAYLTLFREISAKVRQMKSPSFHLFFYPEWVL